ncbi:hypothetical protein [Paracoccus yeei]|uniref:Uncharacterized protein n=1 Tax=Paracoccus yeei TaxID=147645 RepID=A0A5P2QRT9_9RHOB|nr:hypothetical protein [Paracoccus yeei]QEU08768.1 hypothetical protein FOB51_12620 [Paracoccus yeei]
MRYTAALAIACAAVSIETDAAELGECHETSIRKVSSYFPEEPLGKSGVMLEFADGLVLINRADNNAALTSRVGDAVTVCLEYIPEDCPAGDDRGRFYRVINKDSGGANTLTNSPHSCGGA